MKKTHQTKTTHHPPYLETGYSLFNPISLYRNYVWGPFPVKTGSNQSKPEVTSNLTPVKKPTKTKLRIIHHNLKQDMIQAFVVLMYSSLSSDFKKTHHQFIIQLSVIHQ